MLWSSPLLGRVRSDRFDRREAIRSSSEVDFEIDLLYLISRLS